MVNFSLSLWYKFCEISCSWAICKDLELSICYDSNNFQFGMDACFFNVQTYWFHVHPFYLPICLFCFHVPPNLQKTTKYIINCMVLLCFYFLGYNLRFQKCFIVIFILIRNFKMFFIINVIMLCGYCRLLELTNSYSWLWLLWISCIG